MSLTAPPQDPPQDPPKKKKPETTASSPDEVPPATPKRRRWLRYLAIFGAMLMVVGIAAVGVSWYLVRKAVSDIPTVEFRENSLDLAGKDEPINFMLIGSDTREGGSGELGGGQGQVGGHRSDTLMILQLDPRRDRGIVLSIPRDTYVTIPGHGQDKINAAYAIGGSQLALDTVKQFTGLPIHHYVEVDFEGFTDLVDAVGGVDICVDAPIRDEMSGLNLKEAGCHHLTGEFALAYARSRSPLIFEDGRWKPDTAGDFGRIQRQQYFLRAMMKRAISINAIARWNELSKAVQKGVKTDPGMNEERFLMLYNKFGSMTPEQVEMLSMPGETGNIRGASVVIPKEPDTTNLFRSLGSRLEEAPLPSETSIPSQQIQVKVLNGTSTMGLAAQVASKLRDRGFFVVGTGDTRSLATTEIVYEKGSEQKARAVKEVLGKGALVESKSSVEGDVVVRVGRDYTG